jgi:copper chaperone
MNREMESQEIVLRIDGMHCGACVRRVTRALQQVPGTEVGEVRVGAARVHASDDPTTKQSLVASLSQAGFSAHIEG